MRLHKAKTDDKEQEKKEKEHEHKWEHGDEVTVVVMSEVTS